MVILSNKMQLTQTLLFYRQGYTLQLLKCLSKSEVEYVLKEIHEVYGGQIGRRIVSFFGYILLTKALPC